MRICFVISILLCCAAQILGQEPGVLEGRVSYKSSSSVYVKFNSTEAVTVGDTLYRFIGDTQEPALVITRLSSISGVCTPIDGVTLDIGDKVVYRRRLLTPQMDVPARDTIQVLSPDTVPRVLYTPEPELADVPQTKSSLTGRVALSWYGNFYKTGNENIQRMRYVVAVNANNIGGGKVSFESYLSFRHTIGEWSEVQANFGRWFKAYNMSVVYRPNRLTELSAGRRINRYISNIGAIDGVQGHRSFGKFQAGAFGGFRPDHQTYGFNPDLLQFGVYGVYGTRVGKGEMLNTLSFVQQFRSGATDRRFLYLQHTNTILQRVYVFTSFEFDLYKNIQDSPTSTFRLTSLYVSARYRASRKLSLFLSYDARNNVIYFETYKNTIDRLIDEEARQGLRLRLNLRPLKRVTVGVSGGYRFQATTGSPATNAYLYLAYSQIPWVKASISASYTYIKTDYLQGNIYGVRLSRDIVKGKVFANVQYRYVDYAYAASASELKQNVLSTNITWRVVGRTAISVFYEGLFSDWNDYNRFHINLTYRL